MAEWLREVHPNLGDCIRVPGDPFSAVLFVDAGDWVMHFETPDGFVQAHRVGLARLVAMFPSARANLCAIHRNAREVERKRLRESLAAALSALRKDDSERVNGLVDDLDAWRLEGMDRELASLAEAVDER